MPPRTGCAPTDPRILLALAAAASLTWTVAAGAQTAGAPIEVRFPVRDSVTVIADVYRASAAPAAATILLFHQGGGSARGEYRNITSRLLREGYNVIAADIRGGGDRFGTPNRVRTPPAGSFGYCDALAEVDATVNLARVQGFGGPLVLWGSSYSAALALQVGARRSADVGAVLAFSPASGEPMRGCEPGPYVGWLTRAGVPTLVLRPRAELEDTARLAAFEAMRRDGAAVHVAERGVHGSSMLDPERTGASTDPQWQAVLSFLRGTLSPRAPASGERRVSIASDDWNLQGDLRLPARAPAPLVVLLHKAAGDRAIYRDLAARLAAAGIGSLRVDLRGHGASTTRGRFVPGQADVSLEGTERDVRAIWRFVRATPGVDSTRLALVGGSYSSQAAALAGQAHGYGRAVVALSPGDFSDDSFRAAAASRAAWLFVRSDDERFVREWLDAKVRDLASTAEVWVVPAGSAHATDLLAADSTLALRLTDWLAKKLR
jgi:dienelactone hydrolase